MTMATQPFNTDVFVKGPLTVGTDLLPDQIQATLHLKQEDTSKELARLESIDGTGLRMNLAGATPIPNLQGLAPGGGVGMLALNPEGGDLELGRAGSKVCVPGSLNVVGGITVGGKEVISSVGKWMGDSVDLRGPGITDVKANTGQPGSQALAELEDIGDSNGNKRVCLTIPRGDKGLDGRDGRDGKDGEPGRQGPGITDVRVTTGQPGSQATATLENMGDGNKRVCLAIPRGDKGDPAPSLTHLKDKTLWIRNDEYHGIGWYGVRKPFAGTDQIDGPVIFGFSGGALGINHAGAERILLKWDKDNNVDINKVRLFASFQATPNDLDPSRLAHSLVQRHALLLLYDGGGENWAGIGVTPRGYVWIRSGTRNVDATVLMLGDSWFRTNR